MLNLGNSFRDFPYKIKTQQCRMHKKEEYYEKNHCYRSQ